MKTLFFELTSAARKPFGNVRDIEVTTCPQCMTRQTIWERVWIDMYEHRRGQWPDFIKIDLAPSFVISEACLEQMLSNGIDLKSVPIRCVGKGGEAKTYHVLLPDRLLPIDLCRSGATGELRHCAQCGFDYGFSFSSTFASRIVADLDRVKTDAWLMRARNWNTDRIFCGSGFLMIAREMKWKGWKFEPLGMSLQSSGVVPKARNGIDYLGEKFSLERLDSW